VKLEFRRADREDARYIGENLRPLDRAELLAACPFQDPKAAVMHSLELSHGSALVATHAGEPIAIFGISPRYMAQDAIPWFLGTPRVEEFSRDLVKWARPVIARWLDEFPLLLNEVWVSNRPAVRFLRHAGFSFAAPRENQYGAEMMLFYKRRPACAA
jgi:hypothetical protein